MTVRERLGSLAAPEQLRKTDPVMDLGGFQMTNHGGENEMKNSTRCMLVLLLLMMAFSGVKPTWAGDIPLVKQEELKKMIDEGRGDFVVVDNQPKASYDMGHIPGAVNLPWAAPIKKSGNLPQNKSLILYCGCEHEEDATDVANQLIQEFGYRDVKVLEGGWFKWVKLGYPVEKKK
jgi:rhodanese-related sulfurtransferase